MADLTLNTQVRSDLGRGASHRPCRNAGLTPAVAYGGDKESQPVTLELHKIAKFLENEAAFSHVIALNAGDTRETMLIKALQCHPVKGFVIHADFPRAAASHKLTAHVSLHFTNEEVAIGVKQSGGEISHTTPEVEASYLPKDLPEFIKIGMTKIELGQIVRLSGLKVPKGVELVQLVHGNDLAVANIHASRVVKEEDSEGGAAERFTTQSPFYREGLPS